MARYKICKNCGNSFKLEETVKTEGGTTYREYSCPYCGTVVSSNISHIHYGNDGIR